MDHHQPPPLPIPTSFSPFSNSHQSWKPDPKVLSGPKISRSPVLLAIFTAYQVLLSAISGGSSTGVNNSEFSYYRELLIRAISEAISDPLQSLSEETKHQLFEMMRVIDGHMATRQWETGY